MCTVHCAVREHAVDVFGAKSLVNLRRPNILRIFEVEVNTSLKFEWRRRCRYSTALTIPTQTTMYTYDNDTSHNVNWIQPFSGHQILILHFYSSFSVDDEPIEFETKQWPRYRILSLMDVVLVLIRIKRVNCHCRLVPSDHRAHFINSFYDNANDPTNSFSASNPFYLFECLNKYPTRMKWYTYKWPQWPQNQMCNDIFVVHGIRSYNVAYTHISQYT